MTSRAQEVAPFRLTAVDGYASSRFLSDDFATRQPGTTSGQALRGWRTEVFVMTHSYVYHPNFLTLDVGGGPILERGRFSADSGDTSSSGTLYNLSVRAAFLRDKPYRGSVFYERLNPTLAYAPGSVLTQENTRYGFDFSMLAPVPVNVDASRFRTRGRSVDRIVDNDVKQFNLQASQPIGDLGVTQFRYQASRQDSMSGSPNLPIQQTSLERQNYQLDTRLRLGARRQYELYNLVFFDTQAYGLSQNFLPQRNDRRLLLDLRGRHSERLNTFATYTFSSSEQGTLSTTLNAASAGASYSPTEDLWLRAAARADDNRTAQFAVTSRGVDGSAQYKRALGPGVLSASHAVRFDQRDQQASARANIIGESVTLTGTTPVALSQPRVIATSVVVNNATRTQTFTEGIDYLLSVLGLQTRLQRLVGGNILDGQELLVDYAFDPGGTFAFNQIDHTLSLDWTLGSYLNVYFRYFDSAPKLVSGVPSSPLNAVESTLYGARGEFPLSLPLEVVLGGWYQQENRRETIAPYRRQQYEGYAQTVEPFFGRGTLRVTARRVNQKFENSAQDVRLEGYDASLSTRHPLGIDASVNATYERDTGSLVPRTRMLATARLQWRYRKASVTMDFTRTREGQGDFERSRTLGQIVLRRDF